MFEIVNALRALSDSTSHYGGAKEGFPNDILSVVKGFRNGLVYGAKIRLPHAAVMTFLFRADLL